MLTGARAPLFYAVAVTAVSLLSIRSTVFAARHRLVLILSALALLPVLALLAGALGEIRLFNVVVNETTNLSGRGLLWPNFEEAAARSPWFGWGVGAGNVVIPHDSEIVQETAHLGRSQRIPPHQCGGRSGRPDTPCRVVRGLGHCPYTWTAPVGPTDHAAGVPGIRWPRIDRQRADLNPCLRDVRVCRRDVCPGRSRTAARMALPDSRLVA